RFRSNIGYWGLSGLVVLTVSFVGPDPIQTLAWGAPGRTRMPVFPARRSVALKVATASSRAETLPMFVRSRPSRTRWTISPSWARSDSTTKSTARPSTGRDTERARSAAGGPRLGRPDDGHQCSSGLDQACGPLLNVAADDIEHQIDAADVFQRVVVEVDELLRAEVEHLLTVGRAPGADDIRASLARELRHHRTDCAGRAVREDALPRLKAAVLEQSLPRGKARDWQARAHREVDVARQRREVACLDRYILRQGAVAMPVGEAEHSLSYRQSR